ncbi:NAD(P)H-binding protein [Nocardia thailandica]
MRLTIFGANGPTGRLLTARALDRGHDVVAVTRRPADFPLTHDRLTVFGGDVREPESVGVAIAGADAVLSTLGVPFGKAEITTYSVGAAAACDAPLHQIRTDLTADGAYAAVRDFLRTRPAPPDAVVVGTYGQTAATTRALTDHGLRIPEDVRVVGFDGNQAKYGPYDLTSARQPVDRIARRALDELLTGPSAPADRPAAAPSAPELHLGDTCGCRTPRS